MNILLPLMCGLPLCSISFGDLDGFALALIEYRTDQANGQEKPLIPELYSLRSAEGIEHATTPEGKCA